MEFNFISLFAISIVLMTVAFYVYFIVRAAIRYHDASSNRGSIIFGSIISGVGAGVLLCFCLCCVLPTHYYITSPNSDGHYKRYVIDSEFGEKYGRSYIVNLTNEDYYLCAMKYGDASFSDDEDFIVPLPSGNIVEAKHEVNVWFKSFPDRVRSERKGKTVWHVLTAEQVVLAYEDLFDE